MGESATANGHRSRPSSPKIGRETGGVLSLRVWAMATGFGGSVLAARLLSPDSFGMFALASSAATIGASVAIWGADQYLMRDIAASRTGKRLPTAALGALLTRWNGRTVAVAVFAVVVYLVFVARLSVTISLLTAGLVVPALAVSRGVSAVVRGQGKPISAQLPEATIWTFFVVGLVAIDRTTSTTSPNTVVAAFGICALVGAGVAVTYALRYRQRTRPLIDDETSASPGPTAKAFRMSIAIFGAMSVLRIVNRQIDVLIVGAVSDTADVAEFEIARRIGESAMIGLFAVNQVIGPQLAAAHARGDRRHLQHLLRQSIRLGLITAIPLITAATVAGPWAIPWLFGDDYDGSYRIMLILFAGQLLNVGVGSVGLCLSMSNLERVTLRGLGFSLAVAIPVEILLGIFYGPVGVAVGSAAGLGFLNIVLLKQLRTHLGIGPGLPPPPSRADEDTE